MKNFKSKIFNKISLVKLIVIIIIFAMDLITKNIFANVLKNQFEISIIPNFFSLKYTENTGAAYGMFGNNTIMLTIFSMLFIVMFTFYDILYSEKNIWNFLGFCFVIGGAIGNLADRLFLGFVRDFAVLHVFNFIFNVADAFITFGVVFYMISIVISLTKKKENSNLKGGNNDL